MVTKKPQSSGFGLQSFKKAKGGGISDKGVMTPGAGAPACTADVPHNTISPGHAGHCVMKLQVLGCAGGIGGRERLTTSLLVDDTILLDAGTGLTSLDVEQLALIDHVFITHSHLDHVAGLALLVDAVQGRRTTPVTVHATERIVAALQRHLFNWVLWPDFAMIPDEASPSMQWNVVNHGATVQFKGCSLTSHAVNHTVGSAAYLVQNERSGFLFTGDMASTPELWQAMREEKRLSKIIVDCSFSDADMELAARSMHFCPSSLIADIGAVPDAIEFLIYHLKPGQEELIMQQLETGGRGRAFRALKCGDIFEF
jgi:3',5'-cyclic-nucleotide phosphodiesterase